LKGPGGRTWTLNSIPFCCPDLDSSSKTSSFSAIDVLFVRSTVQFFVGDFLPWQYWCWWFTVKELLEERLFQNDNIITKTQIQSWGAMSIPIILCTLCLYVFCPEEVIFILMYFETFCCWRMWYFCCCVLLSNRKQVICIEHDCDILLCVPASYFFYIYILNWIDCVAVCYFIDMMFTLL